MHSNYFNEIKATEILCATREQTTRQAQFGVSLRSTAVTAHSCGPIDQGSEPIQLLEPPRPELLLRLSAVMLHPHQLVLL